jgi:hypothetical protein
MHLILEAGVKGLFVMPFQSCINLSLNLEKLVPPGELQHTGNKLQLYHLFAGLRRLHEVTRMALH